MLNEIKETIFSKKVSIYKEEVILRNQQNFYVFGIVGAITSAAVLIYGLLMRHVVTFNTEFFIFFLYSLGMLAISKFFIKRLGKNITLCFYIALSPLMIIAILMGTFLDPHEPSITIMVFLCALPLFILDKPIRIVAYITVTATVYTICCFIAKEYTMYVADMIDLVLFYFLAIGINVFSLNDRIQGVESFVKFREKSQKDLLTGIYNRGTGVEKIEQMLSQKTFGAFAVIDIDDFKNINDHFGHMAGDRLLRRTADLIVQAFAEQDIIFRLGGDEFAVYILGAVDSEQCVERFEALLEQINRIQMPGLENQPLGLSIGCSIYDSGEMSFERIYRTADESLYAAKKLGKGRCIVKKARE